MNNNNVNILRTQSEYLDEKINFIGCYEELQKDFNVVCNQIGIEPYELPHYNKSQHEHWSTFWDDELNAYIEHKYKDDFDNFIYRMNVVINGVENN
jgi:hypothetical protein